MNTLRWLFLLAFVGAIFSCEAASKRLICKQDGFSIEPPSSFVQKPKLHKKRQDEQLLITMGDDFGTLFRLEHCLITDDIKKIIQRASTVTFLTSFFEDAAFLAIKESLPGVEIVEKTSVPVDSETTGYFYLCDFPEESLMVSKNNNEAPHCMRGHLIFMKEDHLLILAYQTDLTYIALNNSKDKATIELISKRYLESLIKAAQSFKVEL